jgi:hypothetical protein
MLSLKSLSLKEKTNELSFSPIMLIKFLITNGGMPTFVWEPVGGRPTEFIFRYKTPFYR